jgi:hypothetical protein
MAVRISTVIFVRFLSGEGRLPFLVRPEKNGTQKSGPEFLSLRSVGPFGLLRRHPHPLDPLCPAPPAGDGALRDRFLC